MLSLPHHSFLDSVLSAILINHSISMYISFVYNAMFHLLSLFNCFFAVVFNVIYCFCTDDVDSG
jgi:hypothetical protein